MRRALVGAIVLLLFACNPGPTSSPTKVAKKIVASATPTATPSEPKITSVPPVTPAPATPAPSPSTAVISPSPTPIEAVVALKPSGQAADTWVEGPALQRPRAGLSAGVIGNSVLVAGGESLPTTEHLEADSGLWRLDTEIVASQQANNRGLNEGFRLGVAGVYNKGLLVAGTDSSGHSSALVFEFYNEGLVAQTSSLVLAVRAAAGAVVGDHLVVVGGLLESGDVSASSQRSLLPGLLTEVVAPMPLPVAGAAAAAFGDKLYVFGGYTLSDDGAPLAQSAVQVFDVAQDTWRSSSDGQTGAPAPLTSARHSAAAITLGDAIYLVGGASNGKTPLSTVERFDPATNKWTTLAGLPTPRALLALAVRDGKLLAIGGFGTDGRALASTEVYQP